MRPSNGPTSGLHAADESIDRRIGQNYLREFIELLAHELQRNIPISYDKAEQTSYVLLWKQAFRDGRETRDIEGHGGGEDR